MKLFCDRKTVEYHPATGLNLIPGTHDYPDDKVDDLIVAGLKDPKEIQKAKERAEAKRLKAAAVLEGKE